MLEFVIFITLIGTNDKYKLSQVLPLSHITNLSLLINDEKKNWININSSNSDPLRLTINNLITIKNSYFYRMAMPLFHGFSTPFNIILKTKFSACSKRLPMLRLSGEEHSITQRSSHSEENKVELKNTVFSNCYSPEQIGGCLYLFECTTTIMSCRFFQGLASKGGAVFIKQGKLAIEESHFANCRSISDGGAMLVQECIFSIRKCSFVLNKADNNAGAIYLKTCSLENMMKCLFYDNRASNSYGAALLEECSGLLIDCCFKGNEALKENKGQSLVVKDNVESLNIEHCKFYDTEAFPILIYSSSATYIFDNKMAASAMKGIFFVNDATKPAYVMANTMYDSYMLEEAPPLPHEIVREEFVYAEKQPSPAFGRLCLMMGLLTLVAVLTVCYAVIVILPGAQIKKGYQKQKL